MFKDERGYHGVDKDEASGMPLLEVAGDEFRVREGVVHGRNQPRGEGGLLEAYDVVLMKVRC